MNVEINEKKTMYSPRDLGYIDSKINEIDNHLTKLILNKDLVSGGYILSKNNKVFAHKTLGRLRYNDELSFKPDSLRRIASLTKLFTAVSIMMLIEQGKIHLKQPVRTIIKEFEKNMYKEVTIFNLLTHTGGVLPTPGSLNEPYPINSGIFDNPDWIKEALRGNIYAEPNSVWAYSSFGYMILAEIVQRIEGISFEDYVLDKICKPIGMVNTFFRVPEELYDTVSISDKHSEELFRLNGRINKGAPKGNTGIYSTLEDMMKFGNLILNKGVYNGIRILSKRSVEEMTRNHLSNVRSYCWNDNGIFIKHGLGFSIYDGESLVSPGTFGHEGAGLTGIFIDPIEDFVLVYFCPLPLPVNIPEASINLRNIVWSGLN